MKALRIMTLTIGFAAMSVGSAFAQTAGAPESVRNFVFDFVRAFYSNDAKVYYALTQEFRHPQYESLGEVIELMEKRHAPYNTVLSGDFGDINVALRIIEEKVESVEIVSEEVVEHGMAKVYGVRTHIRREHQVISKPMVMREDVEHTLYIIYRDGAPDDFMDFESTLSAELMEMWIL